jgi:hypothetical protein
MSQASTAPASSQTSNQSTPAQGGKPAHTPELDLEALADKVYRLMVNDLRLSKHRGSSAQLSGTRHRKK